MQTLDYNDLLSAIVRSDAQTDSNDWSDVIYADYSGRSMYGRECFGLVLPDTKDYLKVMISLVHETDEETVLELNDNMRTDNMGHDYIYYFPNWELENAPETEDEEDEE